MHLKLFMNNSLIAKLSVVFVTLFFGVKVFAHYPTLSCELNSKDDSTIQCLAGYSDASLAGEVILEVYSYNEELLSTVKTASDGSASLPLPNVEFYIVFNPGHESPAEFDYAELQ